jgi:hypothetical protein
MSHLKASDVAFLSRVGRELLGPAKDRVKSRVKREILVQQIAFKDPRRRSSSTNLFAFKSRKTFGVERETAIVGVVEYLDTSCTGSPVQRGNLLFA